MWQILAFFIARGLDRQLHFHLVHHLTLGAHWKPSFLALLPIPFIWGPVGGAEEAPAALAASLGRKAWLYEKIRNLRLSVIDLDPFVKITARRAQIVLTKTEDTAARVRQFGARRVRVVSEAGLPEAELEYLGSLRPRSTQPFRFLCLGRLLYWKGFELAIRAFAESSRILTNVELWIVGDGPEMRRLQRIARDLGVSSTVRFLGQMPRSKGLEVLAECDVLVHPSLHDSGGWVCLEAMAAGKPVICLDLGGPGVQVTSEVGLKIRPTTTKQVITDIAQGMGRFASDREYATRLGAAARAHVRANFSWTRRGSVLSRIYSDAYAYAQDSNIANVSAQFTIPPAV
jgi:glycosyltransferase involved in cell wall biosynthesis